MAKIEKIGNIQVIDNKEDRFFYFLMISMVCTGSGYREVDLIKSTFFITNQFLCSMKNRIAELDYLKSIFILLMIVFHLVYIGDKYPYAKA